jgi:hypothetical protein
MEPATSEATTMESAAAEAAASRSDRRWSQRQRRCDDRNTTQNRQSLVAHCISPHFSVSGHRLHQPKRLDLDYDHKPCISGTRTHPMLNMR